MYKYIYILICLLGVALGASAQGYRYQNVIQGPRGPLANVPVAVCLQPATISSAPCSPLATLYTDSTLTTACNGTNGCSNPLTSDGYGNVLFYAAPGKYTIQYYGPQFSAPISYQDIVLPCDPRNCTITGGNLTVSSLNKVVYADQETGATADVKIAAACAALPSTGGTIDARGFGATTQTLAGVISCGSTTKPVTFLFDSATIFQPNSTTLTLLSVLPRNTISGFHGDVSNQSGYTGTAILIQGNYRDDGPTTLNNIYLRNSGQTGSGLFIEGTDTNTQSVAFVSVHNVHILGFSACYSFFSSGSGWVNGNYFSDILGDGCLINIYMDATSTTSGAGFNGNTFVNVSSEGAGTKFIKFDGTGPILHNAFDNIAGWDTSGVTIDNTAGNAAGNYFQGRWDGTVTDGTGLNIYLNGSGVTTSNGAGNLIVPGTIASLNASDSFTALNGGIGQRTLRLGNTGGAAYFGIDNSTGSAFGHTAYATNIYTPANPLFITTPSVSSTGPLISIGTAATLTGTGACATNSTQKGGAWAGQATCTGTTGASTFIITPGTTAPNGWSCTASDLTTAANILRQSAVSTTACTIAGTVNANDVLTFTAVAY